MSSDTTDDFEEERWLELVELYAPRRPMTQLADEFRVTPTNQKPPLVHFAFPLEVEPLFAYAKKHNLIKFIPKFPHVVSPALFRIITKHLSEEVQYEVILEWPLRITSDSGVILSLYNNYTIDEKLLIDEDQEDVIQMVQEALGLDASVRPKWYFDFHDPWVPDEP